MKLTEGSSGFCVALMKEGMITTEIPVLALQPIKKVITELGVKILKQKPAASVKTIRRVKTKVDCIACIHLYIYTYVYILRFSFLGDPPYEKGLLVKRR